MDVFEFVFFSHLKKFVLGGCFGPLFLFFVHHYDLRCFLSLCKKHCSLFVKQKRGLTDAFFFTTMIYIVFCSVKNTAVCLWKKKDLFFFSSEKVCFGWMLWTPFSPLWFTLFFVTLQKTLQFVCETKKRTYRCLFFTTMIYIVFCSVKNTAVCLWKKKDLFFFSSEKVCFGWMLWMPFFYHNDLHCFLFCKKHCSLFVKKKRSFFFLIWKSLFWVDAFGCLFTTMIYFVTLQKTLQFVCKKKKRTYRCLFFTTMIYIVFCSVKNTAVCLWKKKDLFFFSSEKVCFGWMLWNPFSPLWFTLFFVTLQKTLQFVCETKKRTYRCLFFYHNDLHCFLFCKKHCSLFVKKKRSFFFLIWKSLFWVDALDAFFLPLWFTLFFVTLQKTLQFVCKKKKRTDRCLFFTTMICFLFCKKKKRSFFFLIWKSLFWVDALEPFFTTMIYVVFCHFAKNTAVCLWNKKEDLQMPFFLPQWFTLFFVL